MPQFRKKPVVIEARQLGNGYDEDVAIMRWCGGRPIRDEIRGEDADLLFDVPTLEGSHQARVGDWIIRGVKGEFYPCKPDIFAGTYEPVGEEDLRLALSHQQEEPLVPSVTDVSRHPSKAHRVLLRFNKERPIDLNTHSVLTLISALANVVGYVTASEYEQELGSAEAQRVSEAALPSPPPQEPNS